MIERTTLAAESADLAVLREEARRRGLSFAALIRQTIAREADELRAARRPRMGLGASGSGAARAASDSPDEPYEHLASGR